MLNSVNAMPIWFEELKNKLQKTGLKGLDLDSALYTLASQWFMEPPKKDGVALGPNDSREGANYFGMEDAKGNPYIADRVTTGMKAWEKNLGRLQEPRGWKQMEMTDIPLYDDELAQNYAHNINAGGAMWPLKYKGTTREAEFKSVLNAVPKGDKHVGTSWIMNKIKEAIQNERFY
jgi:hypothetical protein